MEFLQELQLQKKNEGSSTGTIWQTSKGEIIVSSSKITTASTTIKLASTMALLAVLLMGRLGPFNFRTLASLFKPTIK